MPRGGKRPGAGLPKGYKFKNTLDKAAAREFVRQKVTESLDAMIAAQITHAQGLQFLMVREKTTGKFKRVGRDVAETLNPDEEIIEVWEKEPSVPAFTDLLNRALDKPAEHFEVSGPGGGPIAVQLSERLASARKRKG